MKKTLGIAAVVIFFTAGFGIYKHFSKPQEHPAQHASEMTKVETYWTCPMHPQIHSEKPGECPICHMKLIQVKANGANGAHLEEVDARSVVSASPYELKLSGIQKVAVETMDLSAHIPISGRVITSSRIAFQVYESDLRYIKPGLKFTATSSLSPDEDLSGSIVSVDSIADPTSRTVRVVGAIQKGPRGLISETTFSGEVKVPLKGVVSIPESSVLHAGQSDLVYVVRDDGSLKARAVKLGQKTESYYEVRDGLSPGEFISSGPNFLIDSEAKIRAASMPEEGEGRAGESKLPACPPGQHWDIPMAMCMPGKK